MPKMSMKDASPTGGPCEREPGAAEREPIACSLDGQGARRRLDEFRAAFESGYLGSERMPDGALRWRFRAHPGLSEELRSLAERERACCRFLRFEIRPNGDEIEWDSRVDDPEALPVLEEFFALPTVLARSAPRAREDDAPAFWPGRS
jgi:hypothetical protein